jgi:predicted dehydrogenase
VSAYEKKIGQQEETMTRTAVLVGCGNMAAGWLKALESPALAGRVEIVALVDVDPAAAEKLKAEFGLSGVIVSATLEPVLAERRPDLVFDIAIPDARRDIVLAALRHGCHVLTEKPMATSMAEAAELVGAASRAGRVHAVTQNRRFKEGIRRARATVESGVLGQLTAVHCDFFIGAHFGGFRDAMQHVLLLDMAIHTFDAARFISGMEPEAVYCIESNPAGSWYAHGAAANAIFEFTGGVVVTYRGSWCAEGANTNWDASWRIVGTNGTLLWDGEDGFSVRVVDGDEGFFRPLKEIAVLPPRDLGETQSHASVIAGFLDAIDGGRQPETAGEDNIRSLAMVFAAIESAATRRRVEIRL